MAGSNNIPKYLKADNRENEITLKTRGAIFSQVGNTLLTGTLGTSQLFDALLLDASTPAVITGPSQAQILDALGQNYLVTPGSTFQIPIRNSDNVAKTINFGAPIGSVVVPPNSDYLLGITVLPDGTLATYQPITVPTASGSDPFALVGNGYLVKTGAGAYINRSIVGTSPYVSTGNPGGTGGNTTINVSVPLQTFHQSLSSGVTGFFVQSGAGTIDKRTIIGTAPIQVLNGDGVAGNPVISLDQAALALTATQISVVPPVAGGANVQTALTNINASIPVIPAGPGFVAKDAGGAYFTRTFVAGRNLTITNPDGGTGAPIFAFDQDGADLATQSQNDSVILITSANPSLVWDQAAGKYIRSDTWGSLYPAKSVFFSKLRVPGNAYFGNTMADWDTVGACLLVRVRNFTTVVPTRPGLGTVAEFKTMSSFFNSDTNTTTPSGPTDWQGVADPKNVNLVLGQQVNTALSTPSITVAAHRYKAFSLWSQTLVVAGGAPLDFLGEQAYLRGDGTFAGRAFNVISTRATKDEIVNLDTHLAAVVTGAPAITASEMIQAIKPISYIYKDEVTPRKHFGFLVDDINGEDGLTQGAVNDKFKSLLTYDDYGNGQSIRTDHLLSLLFQSHKEQMALHAALRVEFDALKTSYDAYVATHP